MDVSSRDQESRVLTLIAEFQEKLEGYDMATFLLKSRCCSSSYYVGRYSPVRCGTPCGGIEEGNQQVAEGERFPVCRLDSGYGVCIHEVSGF
jgi:hypothetical protein